MSPLLPAIAAVIAAAPGDHSKLDAGIDLYRKGDLKGSLPLLLEALDSGGAKQRATARLYIGLIQHRTGNPSDAAGSFEVALELWPQIRPPKGTPPATMKAFEAVRARVVRTPDPPKTRERKRSIVRERPDEGPEVLEPIDGDRSSSSRDWSLEPSRDPNEETSVSIIEPPPPEEESFPLLGWIAGSAGAAAAVAGVTLAILAGVNGNRALDEPSRKEAADLHNAAKAQNTAALASFGAAGVLFGVAAISVTF